MNNSISGERFLNTVINKMLPAMGIFSGTFFTYLFTVKTICAIKDKNK